MNATEATNGSAVGVPRVWVGCLACYNAGALVGEWFDAIDAPTEMREWNLAGAWRSMIEAAPGAREPWLQHVGEAHEELWVFDHENFHGLLSGECSPVEAVKLAELLDSVDESQREAFGLYASNVGRDYATVEGFEESYQGEYESERDFAMELAEEIDSFNPSVVTSWPYTCIDWEHAWNELRIGGDYWSAPVGGSAVYIFRSI